MQAAICKKFQEPLEIKQVPVPQPGPDDVLVKLIACGVCHTDLHFVRGDFPICEANLPRIPGHEGIGEVVQLGSNVKEYIQLGDIVGIPWIHQTCLHCEYCVSGREAYCSKLIRSGVTLDGCFAQYALMNAHFAVKLPSGMDPYTSAPIYCAGVSIYKALKTSKVRSGEWVSIVGIGGLGSMGIQYAVAMGMRVLAVVAPNDQDAVQLSKVLGAEQGKCASYFDCVGKIIDLCSVYDGPAEKHGEWIHAKVGGVQASIVTVPLVVAYEQAFESVKPCGRVVGVGMAQGKMSLSVPRFVGNGIELVGSALGTRQDLSEALELAKLHGINCTVQKRPLQEINEILDQMSKYKIHGRIVLDLAS